MIPSVLLTAWLWLVWASGALTGEPSLAAIGRTASDSAVQSALVVAGAAIAAAIVLHPLQFAIVQLLEGYWGRTKFGLAVQVRRQVAHLHRYGRASREDQWFRRRLLALSDAGTAIDSELLKAEHARRIELMTDVAGASAASIRLADYPDGPQEIMATRLGNALRRAETRAGRSYGLPIVMSATHLGMVADPSHTAYIEDQRTQLDLTTRVCASAIVAAAATAAVMWLHGLWLLTALVPYAAAYLSYRGAITAAVSYGQAFSAWSDLNRFALYEALHLPAPASTQDELAQNVSVRDLLLHVESYDAAYSTGIPAPQTPADGAAGPHRRAGVRGWWARRMHR